MYQGHKVSVVVPAHNEETQIVEVVRTMPELVDTIVVVDDCSSDETVKIVTELCQQHSRLVLLKHEFNQGVGGAIATGYKWSRDNDIDLSVVMAGDGQMNPDDMTALLDPVIEDVADYSKGNRLITGEAYKKIPKMRYFGNSILSLFTKIASGYWQVADSQTGYTVVNRKILHAIDWDTMYKRYGQPNDLLVKLNVFGFRVIDVPVEPVYNIGETSGIKVRRVIFTIGSLLVRLFFWRLKEKYIIRNFHPLVFFYEFGFFSISLSLLLFVRLVFLWIDMGQIPEITFLSWLFSFGLGFNALMFSMWFDYEENRPLNPPLRHRDIVRVINEVKEVSLSEDK